MLSLFPDWLGLSFTTTMLRLGDSPNNDINSRKLILFGQAFREYVKHEADSTSHSASLSNAKALDKTLASQKMRITDQRLR